CGDGWLSARLAKTRMLKNPRACTEADNLFGCYGTSVSTYKGVSSESVAAVFLVKIRICGVKNARKMSNLAALFALHLRIFPQKTASQAFWRHALRLFDARQHFYA
ncbi:hypothetical protein, partial [Neisseria dentiae]|uniref:hypothetical protein n=1 Tax=Neisseria dentiae TaxID=194197 RepID=UPI00211C74F8